MMIATLFLPVIAAATAASAPAPAIDAKLDECMHLAASDPIAAQDAARAWLDESKEDNTTKAKALQCLGVAMANSGAWDDAETTFLQARDLTATSDLVARARLAAMAGNTALADGRATAALHALDMAKADAATIGDPMLTSGIEIDRARAMVGASDMDGAAVALASAREANPADWEAWLFSATLARRQGKLVEAQGFIEKAADLRPVDLTVGLEAGVIAALAGHADAARKSWQSVIDAKPKSREAEAARAYIAELDKP
ncbi:MAG: hypothetical protein KDE63_04950 [Novosphingobium sp.]|nr:hypothetical protein [Novosphingobium sp.]